MHNRYTNFDECHNFRFKPYVLGYERYLVYGVAQNQKQWFDRVMKLAHFQCVKVFVLMGGMFEN